MRSGPETGSVGTWTDGADGVPTYMTVVLWGVLTAA